MILVVCTGNLHRSPYLAALLVAGGVPDVASAGTHAPGGNPPQFMIDAALETGIDLSRHRSTQVSLDMLVAADLVITMERNHIIELSVAHPPVFGRSMTLREARVACAEFPVRPKETVASWLTVALADRTTSSMLNGSRRLDTPDPIGGGIKEFRACVADIRESATPLVDTLRALFC